MLLPGGIEVLFLSRRVRGVLQTSRLVTVHPEAPVQSRQPFGISHAEGIRQDDEQTGAPKNKRPQSRVRLASASVSMTMFFEKSLFDPVEVCTVDPAAVHSGWPRTLEATPCGPPVSGDRVRLIERHGSWNSGRL